MSGRAIATADDLPKLVGYQQLRDLYGWPKRTVQDWIKKRKFPKPLSLPGRGNYWALDDIVAWLKGDLSRVAVTAPENLTPEQVEEAAVDLMLRAIEHQIGEAADPAGLQISYGPPPMPVPEAEFGKATAQEAAMLRARFADFDTTRSFVLAAWLFPELRLSFAKGAIDGGVAKVFLDEELLTPIALRAMHEHTWEEGLAAFKAQSTSAVSDTPDNTMTR